MRIVEFLERNFKHFNAKETLEAARAWAELEAGGGKMLVALGGAMSTAELGVSLAAAIRSDLIHAISATAANLEEDLFLVMAGERYRALPGYRSLRPQDEAELRDADYNRVTDTCIPEDVMTELTEALLPYWQSAATARQPMFPFEFVYRLLDDGFLDGAGAERLADSWVVAAHRKRLPIYTPGFEDSTLGNAFAAEFMRGRIASHEAIKPGTVQFEHLIDWYLSTSEKAPVGFFQIGGGIAGDFAICCVACIKRDLKRDCPSWAYYAQVSDSTTSYGSYSGAVPGEKITWHKIDVDTPAFAINSDATIVVPLILAYVEERAGAGKTESPR